VKTTQADMLHSYNLVAEDYAEHFRDEIANKPFDRRLLDWLIDKVGEQGIICDMGCGPGQIARYLFDCGARVCGVDLSDGMIEQARRLHPTITFSQGDMLILSDIADGSYGGIAAFYAIVNIPPLSLAQALRELQRVLCAGGVLLLSFHVGEEAKHLDEWWGKEVNIDFYFYQTAEVKKALEAAGFELEEVIEREPYPEVEYQSRRGYVFARKS
jgi:ubiquinone/menaquinone biosynthesis C-methylase UbiE